MSNWSSLHVYTTWTTKLMNRGSRSNEGRGYFDDDYCLVLYEGAALRDTPSSFLCECRVFTSVRSLGPSPRQLQYKKDKM